MSHLDDSSSKTKEPEKETSKRNSPEGKKDDGKPNVSPIDKNDDPKKLWLPQGVSVKGLTTDLKAIKGYMDRGDVPEESLAQLWAAQCIFACKYCDK